MVFRVSGTMSGTCESRQQVLREYQNYGDRCYVVYPEVQQLTFAQCRYVGF
jgi:hypothetical protein